MGSSQQNLRFLNRTIIVTGASSGIGASIACRLAREGARVVLVARRKDVLLGICEDLRGQRCSAEFIASDLGVEAQREDLCRQVSALCPERIDGLVNAAGIHLMKPLLLNTPDDWKRVMELNVIAPADLISKLAKQFNDGAGIVNISSVAASGASPGASAYGASKAALISLTRSAAVELASRRIRVNALSLGMVRTPIFDQMARFLTQAQKDELEKKHLLGFGSAEDAAGLAAFLLSSEACWVTGTEFVADGGFSIV